MDGGTDEGTAGEGNVHRRRNDLQGRESGGREEERRVRVRLFGETHSLTPFLFMDPAQVVVIFAALRDQAIN